MTKQLTYLLSTTLMVWGLSACDNKTDTETKKSTEPKSQITSAADAITIINPQIRAMPPGQTVTAMYMQLKNSSANNHDLVKVEGNISNMIELHSHTNNDGVMQMGEVESIPVPANSTAAAKTGSYHIMIMGLKEDLKLGEKVDFKLIFKDGSSKSISAEVKTLELN